MLLLFRAARPIKQTDKQTDGQTYKKELHLQTTIAILLTSHTITDVPRAGEVRGFNRPLPLNLHNFCVFTKYRPTVQGLFLYSLNPKFSTGKR